MDVTQFQKILFEKVLAQVPSHVNAAVLISEILGVSTGNAYKKIRHEVSLSLEDALLLSKYFGISLDACNEAMGKAPNLSFEYPAMRQPITGPVDFMQRLIEQLRGIQDMPQAKIWYATSEMPILHYIRMPTLLAFKLHLWARITWRSAEALQFDSQAFYDKYPEIEALRLEGIERYNQIPSCEFWPMHLLEHTLGQLQVYRDSKRFYRPQDYGQLMGELHDFVQYLQNISESGSKAPDQSNQNLEVYFNQMTFTNNMFIVYAPRPVAVMATVDNPNFILLRQPEVVHHIASWLESVRSRSIRISGEGEQYRYFLFKHWAQRLE